MKYGRFVVGRSSRKSNADASGQAFEPTMESGGKIHGCVIGLPYGRVLSLAGWRLNTSLHIIQKHLGKRVNAANQQLK